MTVQTLANAFESALDHSAVIADTAIDFMKDPECASSIPFVSIAAAVYHIGKTVRERSHLEKLTEFIREIAAGSIDEKKRQQYIIGWHADRKKREKELEYLIVIIDRFLHKDMARMLARVYMSFLVGRISWQEVLSYSAVIDRLLPGDYEELKRGDRENIDINDAKDAMLRLVGLGLMISHGKDMQMQTGEKLFIPVTSSSDYSVTHFGKKFLEIIG